MGDGDDPDVGSAADLRTTDETGRHVGKCGSLSDSGKLEVFGPDRIPKLVEVPLGTGVSPSAIVEDGEREVTAR